MVGEQQGTMTTELQIKCPGCGGKGWGGDECRKPCIECDGTGLMLTEFGERLFDFLRLVGQRSSYRFGRE